jgi:hypothetical protein
MSETRVEVLVVEKHGRQGRGFSGQRESFDRVVVQIGKLVGDGEDLRVLVELRLPEPRGRAR